MDGDGCVFSPGDVLAWRATRQRSFLHLIHDLFMGFVKVYRLWSANYSVRR